MLIALEMLELELLDAFAKMVWVFMFYCLL